MKKRKNKAQQAVAAVVMGMNLVNTMSPLALAAQAPVQPEAMRPAPQAQPLEYTVLPQVLQAVEGMVFARAEAGELYQANGGQTINVESVINDDIVYVNRNGTAIVGTAYDGQMEINDGGTNYIDVMSGGFQNLYPEAFGSIGIMEGGSQHVDRGTGIIDIMNDGQQRVSKGYNNNVGTGIIGTMNGGMQEIKNDVGSIGIMNNGMQSVSAGASGSIDTMNNGMQSGAGNMSISVMNGGTQSLTSAATGNIGVMNDGEQQIKNSAVGIISSLNGGTQILNGDSATAKDTIINGGVQLVQNGTAQNNTVNGGTQIISGGVVSGNTVNAGVMLFESSGATVNDVAMNGGEMLFGSAAAYSITSLNFKGGTVDLTENASPNYQTLTLENYSGSGGTFKLDADFAAVTGDKVEINNATNAAGYIQVNGANIDESAVSETKPLLLVTVNNGSATFTGKSLNGGGLYEYNPKIAEGNEINRGANEFYLTGLTKNVNNDTLALLDGIDNSYAMWRNTNDTLRKRLGEIHTLPSNDGADGVWARYIGGKFDGGSYEGQYNLYQLGYDKNYDAKSIIGFALEKGGGNATYSFGSGEDDLFAGAVYGSWLADDGSYTDVVAKIGRFDTELNSYGDFPDSADYRHNAYSLSVEYGKKISLNKAGLYLEPQAQFIAGRLDSVNYTTDRGTKVSVDGINSYIGRVGVMFGQQLENGSNVYIKANLLHEFGGESSLAMLAANGDALTMEKDYGDTWYELGIGANIKIGRASYFYGDIERGFGGDIDKKWQINAGLRFEF